MLHNKKYFLVALGAITFLSVLVLPAAAQIDGGPISSASMTAMIFGRIAERLVIVIFAGMALYLGFRLFSVSAQEAGELVADSEKWKIRMSRIGPGVFFALFGTAVLLYTLYASPFSGTWDNPSVRGAFAMESSAPGALEKAIHAINTVEVASQLAPPEIAGDLSAAFQSLGGVRAKLIDTIVGEGAYQEWSQLDAVRNLNPGDFQARAVESDRFGQVEALLSQTLEGRQ